MRLLFALASLIGCTNLMFGGTIVMEGKYQKKNIYVQNGLRQDGVGFLVTAVYVNGRLTNDEINSTAFEIDLSQHQLKYGQDVTIKIEHTDELNVPRIINPDALQPTPTFEVTSMKMSNDGLITWTATNESGPLPYIIEQFRWNKWINVGEVQGAGTKGTHDYKFLVSALHSGENRFRVKQVGYRPKYSNEIKIVSSTPRCIFSVQNRYKEIDFTCGTLYEMYDYYGNVVKKGYGSKIDIANLQKGSYYICYDNSIGELKKR